jgi:hypothetical protein
MTFSNRTRKCVGTLAALVACSAIIVPTASAMIPDRYHGVHVDTESTQPTSSLHTYNVGATLSDLVQSYEWHAPGVGALFVEPAMPGGNGPVGGGPVESPTTIVVPRFEGLPAGFVALPSAVFSRPAPADNVPALTLPSAVISRPAPADNVRAQAPNLPAELPAFSNDGPRTAPDALVRPNEQPPVAEPGFDWTDAGIGIAIGAIVGLMLGAALLFGRRRGTLAGA